MQRPSRDLSRGLLIGRASVLVPAFLAVWWFALKGVSLAALRVLAWIPLFVLFAPPGLTPIRVDPETGDWLCNVQVNTLVKDSRTGAPHRVGSIEIAMRATDAAAFASGWFSYLALALSAGPFLRRRAKPVVLGLGIQTLVNTLSLALYVYLLGYGTLINSPGSLDSRVWWVRYFDHINSLVVPFASPFLIAIAIHPEWRAYLGLPRRVETVGRHKKKTWKRQAVRSGASRYTDGKQFR